MSNSPLVSYTKLSPNHSGQRTHAVDRITPHCVVGQCSVETLGNIFASTSRQASCQYGIGVDGRVGMYVEEKNRSWCSSSNANDQRAITIECASDATHPYAFNNTVYAKLIELCTDICKRYGKTKLLWFGDKTKTLNYEPASNEMVLTVHRWFANKSCPGDWMYARMGDLASKVTAKLGGSAGGTETSADNQVLYRVQTGAFSNKVNADAMLQKVKAAGFDTYMVKVDDLYKIQVGAFSKKANADAMATKLKAAGFDTYVTTKSGTAVSTSSAKKNTDQIAREVIQGLWGNGVDRTNRLKAAGYDPSVIQNRVNQLLK
nr:MAG TPA: CW7 repeat protein [Caudoviricetes sp.]